jgi:basic amino acid/polyamine antiporter, APA family
VFLGVTGAVILVATVSTSLSGAGRLAYSMGKRAMLPRAFGRLNQRTLIAPVSIVSGATIGVLLLVISTFAGGEVRFLASLYSFGALIAFTAAQLAVIWLRFSEPELARPFRVRGNVRIRGVDVPVAALVGAPLTFALWIAALATHDAARIAGPIWLAVGIAVFVVVRRGEHARLLQHVEPVVADLVPEPEGVYQSILVPVKLGPIGQEMLATAIRLAEERNCTVRALHVIRVPLDLPLDAELIDQEERAQASLADAKLLASEHGVQVEGEIVRARAIGEAIVDHASNDRVDLILLGSAPRWRRQSRFFSPTVDYVLRRAPCEVMVVTYPQGVLEG